MKEDFKKDLEQRYNEYPIQSYLPVTFYPELLLQKDKYFIKGDSIAMNGLYELTYDMNYWELLDRFLSLRCNNDERDLNLFYKFIARIPDESREGMMFLWNFEEGNPVSFIKIEEAIIGELMLKYINFEGNLTNIEVLRYRNEQ